jgi:hypothetical protein
MRDLRCLRVRTNRAAALGPVETIGHQRGFSIALTAIASDGQIK